MSVVATGATSAVGETPTTTAPTTALPTTTSAATSSTVDGSTTTTVATTTSTAGPSTTTPTTGGPITQPSTTVDPGSVVIGDPVADEARFLQLINQLRVGAGLNPLISHSQLRAGARSWTAEMAGYDQLAHAPDLSTGVSATWTLLGENVGFHGVHDVDSLFQAFVNSPAHHRNLVDSRFQYVGVGVVHGDDGKLWTTHRFMAVADPPSTTTIVTTTTTKPTTTASTAITTVPTTVTTKKATTSSTAVTSTAPPTTSVSVPVSVPVSTSPEKIGPTPPTSTAADPATGGSPPTTRPAGVPHDPAGMADLVRPDVETIEELLLDLLTAGI